MVPMAKNMVGQVIPGASELELDWAVPSSMWVIQGPLQQVNKLLSTVIGCRVGPRKKLLDAPRTIQVDESLACNPKPQQLWGRRAGQFHNSVCLFASRI